jgi:hypothetical protein
MGDGALPIDIGGDELELLETMLKDDTINHRLNTIIKKFQIFRLHSPEFVGEVPCIRITSLGGKISAWKQPSDYLDDDNNPVEIDLFDRSAALEIVVSNTQELTYNGIVYAGRDKTLQLISSIIFRILRENLTYENVSVKAVQIDDITVDNFFFDEGFEGDTDYSVCVLQIRIMSERLFNASGSFEP